MKNKIAKKGGDFIADGKFGVPDEQLNIKTGGIFYTVCICVYIFFQLLFSIAVSFTAGGMGKEVSAVTEMTAFKFIAYCVCGTSIFAVAVFFSVKNRTNLLAHTRVKGFSVKFIPIIILGLFGLMLGLGKANDIFLYFLGKFGYKPTPIVLPPKSTANYLLSLLCICLIPAVFEEFLFRGMVLVSFDKISTAGAVLLSGLLFSLFHMSPSQTIYQFLVGCVYALIARKSGSLLPTTIMHFLNNAVIVTLSYYFPKVDLYSGVRGIILMVAGLVILVGVCVYLIRFIDSKEENEKPFKKLTFKDMYAYLGGIAICVFMWVTNVFLGV